MRTSELTGAALDWAAAKCEGWDAPICKNPGWSVPVYVATNDSKLFTYTPSTDWSQGGPIIEREGISITYDDVWTAEDVYGRAQWGDTPLIAAMRCFVASKLGDTVNIPEELKP